MSRLEEVAWWLAAVACVAMLLYPPWYRPVDSPTGQQVESCYNWLLWDQSRTPGREPFNLHLGLLVVQWAVAIAIPVVIGLIRIRINAFKLRQHRPSSRRRRP